jgi:integrase
MSNIDAESACRAIQRQYKPAERPARKTASPSALSAVHTALASGAPFPLAPGVLHHLGSGGVAPSTLNLYSHHWNDWLRWAAHHAVSSTLPASPQDLSIFLSSRADRDEDRGLSAANTRARFAAINFFHKVCNLPGLQSHPILRQLRVAICRRLGNRSVSKIALSRKHLLQFEQAHGQICLGPHQTPTSIRGPLFVFLFALMFEAMLRFDDVQSPRFSDLVWSAESIRIFLTETKTDTEKSGQWAGIIADPSISLAYRQFQKIISVIFGSWLLAPDDIKSQYFKRCKLPRSEQFPLEQIHIAARWELFVSSTRPGFQAWLPVAATTISYQEFLSTLKDWSSALGLNPIDIGTHSLRRGGRSEDAELGLPDTLVMKNGRWKSQASATLYLEPTSHIAARAQALRLNSHLFTP